MEVIRQSHHTAFAMDDGSRVGEARRHAAHLAQRCGMDDVQAGRLALVVTELGNNLVRHAMGGQLLLAVRDDPREVEVVSIDSGPGIADVARCMGDGFSTGGTAGTGLGAVRRLARDFDIHSVVPDGTVIVARVASGEPSDAARHSIRAAGLSVPIRGEEVCGDAWCVAIDGAEAAVMVADGLGHGPYAADASAGAMDVFVANPMGDLRSMLERAHTKLRTTRGAAVTALRLDARDSSVRSCGAGNVTARVVSGDSDRTLMVQHGTAGLQMRRLEEVKSPWPPHALLVVFSDGIESRWTPQRLMPVLGRDPALAAAILLRDHSRGRDDATVVVLRRAD